MSTISRVRLSPTCSISVCPAQAVTPEASSASLTTKSEPMKSTVGSPKPASAWFRSSTPVAQSESAVPIATIATGTRSSVNTTTTAASTRKVIVEWLTGRPREARWKPNDSMSTLPVRHQTKSRTRGTQ